MIVTDPTQPGFPATLLKRGGDEIGTYTVEIFEQDLETFRRNHDTGWLIDEGDKFRALHREPNILCSTPDMDISVGSILDCTCCKFCSNSISSPPNDDEDARNNDLSKIEAKIREELNRGSFYDILFIENDENAQGVIDLVSKISPNTKVIIFLFRGEDSKAGELRKNGSSVLTTKDFLEHALVDLYIAQALGDEGIARLKR